ncbi:MAG TPA: manganese efflux pump [Acidothermaceae bacterium]
MAVLALLLAAGAVGLDNFAAAIAIGLAGLDARGRVRLAVVFGAFEAAMPVAGLALGRHVSHLIGGTTRYYGGALLVGAGAWELVSAIRGDDAPDAVGSETRWGRLMVTAFALSIDNLIVGFGLGAIAVPLIAAIATFGVVSVALSLVGLELGRRLGGRVGERSELLGGAVLVVVGVLIACAVL